MQTASHMKNQVKKIYHIQLKSVMLQMDAAKLANSVDFDQNAYLRPGSIPVIG